MTLVIRNQKESTSTRPWPRPAVRMNAQSKQYYNVAYNLPYFTILYHTLPYFTILSILQENMARIGPTSHLRTHIPRPQDD